MSELTASNLTSSSSSYDQVFELAKWLDQIELQNESRLESKLAFSSSESTVSVESILEQVFEIVVNDVLSLPLSSSSSDTVASSYAAISSSSSSWDQLNQMLKNVNSYFDELYHSSSQEDTNKAWFEFSKLLYKFYATICYLADIDFNNAKDETEYTNWRNQLNELSTELNQKWIQTTKKTTTTTLNKRDNETYGNYRPIALYLLGIYYKEISRFEPEAIQKAIETFQDCIVRYPNMIESYVGLIEINEGLGINPQDNVDLASRALKLTNDAYTLSLLYKYRSMAYFKLAMNEKAMKDYNQSSDTFNTSNVGMESTSTIGISNPHLVEMPEAFEKKLDSYVMKATHA